MSQLSLETEAQWIDTAAVSSDNLTAYVAQTLGSSKMPSPATEPPLPVTATPPEEIVDTSGLTSSTNVVLLPPGPVVQLPDCRCQNLLPPNAATLQAFKTLLVWASKMPKDTEQLPELFLRNRKNLEPTSSLSEGSVLLPAPKHVNSIFIVYTGACYTWYDF
ncbi:unnamed protein product [Dibothriocephalus latus]|uniref:Uncharacterized protein n=1 Tax=Dibothriocephalus latus TaxID=60516 RepID=A0A3P7RN04_DIBLA|nr:unnamed protein product [Dibothriocephalus latus]